MADFGIRSDSVDVEQIMDQIRARIREKRGVDYTEQQIQDLAAVKLEKFLDPKGVRSDLLERFRQLRPQSPPARPSYTFEDTTLFDSSHAPVRLLRRLMRPVLKVFFNVNALVQALHVQADLNDRNAELEGHQAEWDSLYYEMIHNLVVEMTRLSIEVKNMKMRVESISSRLDFSERRARALEGAVQYTSLAAPREQNQTVGAAADTADSQRSPETDAAGREEQRRRRRRRRGRRPSIGPEGAAADSRGARPENAPAPRDGPAVSGDSSSGVRETRAVEAARDNGEARRDRGGPVSPEQ